MLLTLLGVVLGALVSGSIWALDTEPPPMVVKKIFDPASGALPATPTPRGPETTQTVVVTGIMLVGEERKALIVEKKSPQTGGTSASGPWFREGDTVGGSLVEKITDTGVVLAAGAQKVFIPLFGTAKDRPQPVTVSRPAGGPGSTPGPMGALSGAQPKERPIPGAPTGPERPSAPGEAEQTPAAPQVREGSPVLREARPSAEAHPTGFPNPFLEAVQKARQQQESQTPGHGISGSPSQ